MPYEHKTVHGFFTAHPDRWIKGLMNNGESCFCLAGKVYDAYPAVDDRIRAFRHLVVSIAKLYPAQYRQAARGNNNDEHLVIAFNDANRRTIEQIIAVAKDAWV